MRKIVSLETAKMLVENGIVLETDYYYCDVSGQWKSSVNRVYNIKQTNNRFQWTVVNDTEVGEGVVSEKDIYASWKGKMGPGSINGKITSVDSKGKATQILWNNGVWFNR